MKKIILPVGIIVVIIVAAYFILNNSKTQESGQTSQPAGQTTQVEGFSFNNPKKSAHYENNTPAHASVLAAVPLNVVLDFNFDLVDGSNISINKDGKGYGVDQVIIDANGLTMRRNMDPLSPDGLYTVEYQACWPDGSCHDGNFQFAIDRTKSNNYQDFREKKQVSISLSQISFQPQNILISKGTKVTWTNDELVEHFINTDSHPSHTYYLDQNSRALAQGDTYSMTFDKDGIYPYHCSAHADTMTGNLIVEEI